MTISVMHRAACAYAERFGWMVFPIKPGTKEPHPRFVRHGFKEATTNPEQIDRWWTADPFAGIAVACDASDLVVIDADLYKPECEFAALEGKLGALPLTPRQLTPQGGVHHVFRDTVGTGYRHAGPGVETKHHGYVLLAPTVHPNGGIYRWDLGAHPLEMEIAELPVAWLDYLTKAPGTCGNPAGGPPLPSSGIDAADSYLGHAFEAEGWLGDLLYDGKRMVRCPWVAEHSDGRGDGRDSSTVIFPRAAGHTLGGFNCAHAHCAGRSWRDVLPKLSQRAIWSAEQSMRGERNRLAYEQLASRRRTG